MSAVSDAVEGEYETDSNDSQVRRSAESVTQGRPLLLYIAIFS